MSGGQERKQGIWERPRNIVLVLIAAAIIASAAGLAIGYEIAQNPSAPPAPIVIVLRPAK